jgi:hypothetical protein
MYTQAEGTNMSTNEELGYVLGRMGEEVIRDTHGTVLLTPAQYETLCNAEPDLALRYWMGN